MSNYKKYHIKYRDNESYKISFMFDTILSLKKGEQISIEELYGDVGRFFEEVIGYSFNPSVDTDVVNVVDEADAIKGIYILGTVPHQDAVDFIGEQRFNKENTYALYYHEGYWVRQVPPSPLQKKHEYGYHVVGSSTYGSLESCRKEIADKIAATRTVVEPESDTDKYIVCWQNKIGDIISSSGSDHCRPFTEATNGKSCKEQAWEFYNALLQSPDTYAANYCKIIASTDYF